MVEELDGEFHRPALDCINNKNKPPAMQVCPQVALSKNLL